MSKQSIGIDITLDNPMKLLPSHCGLVTWQYGSGSTLVRIMTCCLTTPSHYLNQCWLENIAWHPSQYNFTENPQSMLSKIIIWHYFLLKIVYLPEQNEFIWALMNQVLWIDLFHNHFRTTHIPAYKSEQTTAGCIAIFHKYCCYIKHGGINPNLTRWNP